MSNVLQFNSCAEATANQLWRDDRRAVRRDKREKVNIRTFIGSAMCSWRPESRLLVGVLASLSAANSAADTP